jgi:hypothetical protein
MIEKDIPKIMETRDRKLKAETITHETAEKFAGPS